MSLNVRGVEGRSKFVALKRLIEITHPNIICLQETMVFEDKARGVFSKMFKDWDIYVIDYSS